MVKTRSMTKAEEEDSVTISNICGIFLFGLIILLMSGLSDSSRPLKAHSEENQTTRDAIWEGSSM